MKNKPAFIGKIILLVGLDQFFKWLMVFYWPDLVQTNTGVIFGWVENPLISHGLLVFGWTILIWLIIKNLPLTTYHLPLIFVTAGALSNLIDRFYYGYVIDYFNFFNLNYFNLADILIIAGAILYCWQAFRACLKTIIR